MARKADFSVGKPTRVVIGNMVYDVVYKPLSDNLAGTCEGWLSRICIDTDLSDAVIRSTLWHEALHAMCYVFGRHRNDHMNVKTNMDIEETYVGFLQHAVPMFVRDNPDVWDWINGWLEEIA